MSKKHFAVTLAFLCLTSLVGAQGKPTVPKEAPDLARGKQAFVANCSACHGLDGNGGDRAPGISAGSEAAKLSNDELKRTITNGIAGAGMPPFSSLGQPEIAAIARYLRSLQGRNANVQMPGDPQRGAELFFGQAHCSECHMAGGKGGFLGNDLTGYGRGRTAAEIRAAIIDPQKNGEEAVKQATVVTLSGRTYSGVVRTEDNFSLALQTKSGAFVLLQKADLAKISYNSQSFMPTDYSHRFTTAEINDLVSYLMQLPSNEPSPGKHAAKGHWEEEN